MAGNWTKTPNCIIDAIPDMSEAELKLTMVICRQTYGYHQEAVRMTYDDMEKLTGMSRPAVGRAITAVEERGFFIRGRRSMWSVNSNNLLLNEVTNINQKSNNYELSDDENSNNSLPYYSNNLLPPSYKEKKEEKESKKRKEKNIHIPPPANGSNGHVNTNGVYQHPEIYRDYELEAAISKVVKTPYYPKHEDAYMAAVDVVTANSCTADDLPGFSDWWEENGYYKGKPAISSFMEEFVNYIDSRKPGKTKRMHIPDELRDIIKR